MDWASRDRYPYKRIDHEPRPVRSNCVDDKRRFVKRMYLSCADPRRDKRWASVVVVVVVVVVGIVAE